MQGAFLWAAPSWIEFANVLFRRILTINIEMIAVYDFKSTLNNMTVRTCDLRMKRDKFYPGAKLGISSYT